MIGICLGLSYLMGILAGGGRDSKIPMIFGSTQRNTGAGLMVAGGLIAVFGPEALVAAVVYGLIMTVILVLLVKPVAKIGGGPAAEEKPAEEAPAEEGN
jgi:predicted Na+-dependent transporter